MKPVKDSTTEQLILETAERLFMEKGFAMTSTTEIAREAGCNQALVHYYFRTKENLFQSIFENKLRLLVSSFTQINDPAATFEEKLITKIESHFELIRANPGLPFLIFNELITNPVRLNSLKERLKHIPTSVYQQLESELQAEIAAGRIRPVSTMDLAITILSLNAFLFIASPILKTVLGMPDSEMEKIYEHRKHENVRVVLSSLRPETPVAS
jgi:AcrR family transcriptional regulator